MEIQALLNKDDDGKKIHLIEKKVLLQRDGNKWMVEDKTRLKELKRTDSDCWFSLDKEIIETMKLNNQQESWTLQCTRSDLVIELKSWIEKLRNSRCKSWERNESLLMSGYICNMLSKNSIMHSLYEKLWGADYGKLLYGPLMDTPESRELSGLVKEIDVEGNPDHLRRLCIAGQRAVMLAEVIGVNKFMQIKSATQAFKNFTEQTWELFMCYITGKQNEDVFYVMLHESLSQDSSSDPIIYILNNEHELYINSKGEHKRISASYPCRNFMRFNSASGNTPERIKAQPEHIKAAQNSKPERIKAQETTCL
ncbi:9998_t:CDS:2 [Paraglomus brasilianum]|uniref:9998_t:CDS:1 n=1 Tax=Paraglomus brasilianum TaxID=144538 RepID=A0A9N9CK88_9GLOM|nr:9998_t:CDS:2 [Paraglomus brasilianum]